jgi:hypothetical protein
MKYLILIILLMFVFACEKNSTGPEESEEFDFHIQLLTSQTEISLGDDVQIDVRIEECTEPIFAVSLQLEFDNTILNFTESQNESEFFGDNCIIFVHETDGIVYTSASLIQDDEKVSGSGSLFSLTFTSVATGTSELNILLNEIKVYDEEGNYIEIDNIQTENIQINVN